MNMMQNENSAPRAVPQDVKTSADTYSHWITVDHENATKTNEVNEPNETRDQNKQEMTSDQEFCFVNQKETMMESKSADGVGNIDIGIFMDDNEFIDLDSLYQILDEGETEDENVNLAAVKNECCVGDNNELCDSSNIRENGKTWVRRKRYKKGTPEYALRKQEYKIKNRVSAAEAFERKKVHIRALELQVQELRKENAHRRRLLESLERNRRVFTRERRLRRTASGPM